VWAIDRTMNALIGAVALRGIEKGMRTMIIGLGLVLALFVAVAQFQQLRVDGQITPLVNEAITPMYMSHVASLAVGFCFLILLVENPQKVFHLLFVNFITHLGTVIITFAALTIPISIPICLARLAHRIF
jgi:hypothetical protein